MALFGYTPKVGDTVKYRRFNNCKVIAIYGGGDIEIKTPNGTFMRVNKRDVKRP